MRFRGDGLGSEQHGGAQTALTGRAAREGFRTGRAQKSTHSRPSRHAQGGSRLEEALRTKEGARGLCGAQFPPP